uniref:Diguanylate cyclase/phosphodiesterase with PAS/PAC and GAF sensor(S) n=1 Tax=Leptospirillum ferrodiazotrophum TaxID=412449 RepID=C6HXY9_9BACT|nr:MAG: diguanylate cyclase/phosphodiesterase with PAS/PAC and GAF sensor(s) [Leptospirillum ferrodiazotrophum]
MIPPEAPPSAGGEGAPSGSPDDRKRPFLFGTKRTVATLLDRWVELLVVSLLLFSGGSVVFFEISKFAEAREHVRDRARQAAIVAGEAFSGNLSSRFIDLGFVASAIAPHEAGQPDSELRKDIRILLALHPGLVDFEIQQGYEGPVLWSTRSGGGPLLTPSVVDRTMRSLPFNPSLRVGRPFFSPAIGTTLLPLGALVPGSSLYVRTHVRMDALLPPPPPGVPSLFRMDFSYTGQTPTPEDLSGPPARSLQVPVESYPFRVTVSWPPGTAFLAYKRVGHLRWSLEISGLLFLSGLGMGVIVLSRRQERLLRTLGDLSALDAAVFEEAGAVGLVIASDGRILRMNRAARDFMGLPEGRVPEEPYAWERFLPEDEHSGIHDLFERMRSRTIAREYENHWVRPSGERRLFRWTNTVVDEGGGRYLVTLGVDITERERLAGLLREKNDRLMELLSYNTLRGRLLEAMADAEDESSLMDLFCRLSRHVPGVVLAWVGRPDPATGEILNLASDGATGYLEGIPLSVDASRPEGQGPIGQSWRSGLPVYNPSFENNPLMAPWRERAARFGIRASANVLIRKNQEKYAFLTLYLDHEESFSPELREILDAIGASLSLALDRLDLKHREEESRALSEALLSNAAAGIDLVRYPERVVVAANEAFLRIFGFSSRAEIVGKSVREIYFDEEGFSKVGELAARALSEGKAFDRDITFRRRSDGKRVWADAFVHCVPDATADMLVWTVVDVTERHELALAVERLSRFRNLLARVTRILAERGEEEGLYQEICDRVAELGEIALAWIGVPMEGGRLRFLGAAGAIPYMEGLSITIEEGLSEGGGPSTRVWRSGEPIFNLDLAREFAGRPQALHLEAHGLANLGLLPLFRRGRPWGLLALYLVKEETFDDSLQDLLREMAMMISEGLDRLDEKRRDRVLSSAVAAVGEGVSISDLDGKILFVNESFTTITGYSQEEVQGKNLRILQGEGTESKTVEEIRRAIEGERPFRGQILNYRKDGSPFWNLLTISPVRDESGRLVEFVGVQRDVTEIVEVSQRLEHESLHDRLTGLPNRRALDRAFAMAFERSQRYRINLAVVMIDLDGFKPVNDRFDHEAGDRLLMAIGERVGRVLRKTDFLARLGGDEFVLLVENYAGTEELLEVLRRVAEAIGREFLLPGGEGVQVGVSMGVATTEGEPEAESPDALLRLADQALYESKAHKSDRETVWVVFGEGVAVRKNPAQQLLATRHLVVFYQPILDLGKNALVGLEALARLKGDDGILLSPREFLGSLSSSDLFELTRQVLERVLVDIPALSERFPDLWVSVNVDPQSVTEECVTCLGQMLEGASVASGRIFLEILEARDFAENSGILETLHHLRNLGVRLAMDDVGSAYSSLLRLKELPVDKVKLDQGFIRTIEDNPRDLHFVGAVQELVSRMGLTLVVEGVETEGVLDAMRSMEIDMLQGYALSRPLPFDGILAFLEGFVPDRRSHPTTLFGLYALTLALHGRMSRNVRVSPTLFDPRRLAEAENCPVQEALERLGIHREDPLMVLHEEFHRHMAYFVRSLVTYGTVTEVVDQDFQRSGEELLAAILGAYHISRPKEGGKSAKNEV